MLLLTGIAVLFLATGTAHAEDLNLDPNGYMAAIQRAWTRAHLRPVSRSEVGYKAHLMVIYGYEKGNVDSAWRFRSNRECERARKIVERMKFPIAILEVTPCQ